MRIHQAPCKWMKVILRFCIFSLCGKKINLRIWRRECHPNFIIQVSLSDLDSLMIRRMSQACAWQACDECHRHACKACNAGANGKALIILHWLNGRHGEKQARSRNAKREGRGEEQVCTQRKKWQERLRLPSYFPARRFNPFEWLIDALVPLAASKKPLLAPNGAWTSQNGDAYQKYHLQAAETALISTWIKCRTIFGMPRKMNPMHAIFHPRMTIISSFPGWLECRFEAETFLPNRTSALDLQR